MVSKPTNITGVPHPVPLTPVDGCEILRPLIGGKHPIIFFGVPTIRLVVQDFAGPSTVDPENHLFWVETNHYLGRLELLIYWRV